MLVTRLLASDFPSENPRTQTTQLSIYQPLAIIDDNRRIRKYKIGN